MCSIHKKIRPVMLERLTVELIKKSLEQSTPEDAAQPANAQSQRAAQHLVGAPGYR